MRKISFVEQAMENAQQMNEATSVEKDMASFKTLRAQGGRADNFTKKAGEKLLKLGWEYHSGKGRQITGQPNGNVGNEFYYEKDGWEAEVYMAWGDTKDENRGSITFKKIKK